MRALNVWYDHLPEPWRFILFLSLIGVPLSVALVRYPLVGLAFAAVIAFARVYRWR